MVGCIRDDVIQFMGQYPAHRAAQQSVSLDLILADRDGLHGAAQVVAIQIAERENCTVHFMRPTEWPGHEKCRRAIHIATAHELHHYQKPAYRLRRNPDTPAQGNSRLLQDVRSLTAHLAYG